MPSYVAFLRAVNVGGRFVKMAGLRLASPTQLANGFQNTKLTNTRIERITGRTTTWRDLKVVRALDEKWGA